MLNIFLKTNTSSIIIVVVIIIITISITITITIIIIIIITSSATIMSYHNVAQVALVAQAGTTCLSPSALYAWDGMVQRLPCPMVLLQRMQAIGAQGHKIVMLQSEL